VVSASVKSIKAAGAFQATEEFVNLVFRYVAEGPKSQLVSVLLKINPTPTLLLARVIDDLVENDVPGFTRPADTDAFARQIALEISQIQPTPAAFDEGAFDKMVESKTAVDADFSCIPSGIPKLAAFSLKGTPYDPAVHVDAFHTAMIHQYFAWDTPIGKTFQKTLAKKMAEDAGPVFGPVAGPAAGTSKRAFAGLLGLLTSAGL